jgi:LacI family transcriptional regulator
MSREKEVTIYDIADKLNISIATVSRALKDDPVVNKKRGKKIFELAEQLGYRSNHFARNLRNQRTETIGVIVPRLNSYFMSTVIAGIESVANNEGYNLIISQSSESEQKEKMNAKTMFNNRVDGLLVSLSYDTNDLSHFDQFSKKNIPVIFFDRGEQHTNFTNVLIDNRKSAYEATTHLIKEGCKNYAHYCQSKTKCIHRSPEGYKDALAENNIEFKEDLLIIGNLSLEAGIDAAAKILSMDRRPDGVLVANDTCAVGCMLSLKQSGVSPGEIAFVGFNNALFQK